MMNEDYIMKISIIRTVQTTSKFYRQYTVDHAMKHSADTDQGAGEMTPF